MTPSLDRAVVIVVAGDQPRIPLLKASDALTLWRLSDFVFEFTEDRDALTVWKARYDRKCAEQGWTPVGFDRDECIPLARFQECFGAAFGTVVSVEQLQALRLDAPQQPTALDEGCLPELPNSMGLSFIEVQEGGGDGKD